jgi:hypothetical protein
MNGLRRALVVFLSLALFVGPWGRATALEVPSKIAEIPTKIAEEEKAKCNNVGVASARYSPKEELPKPKGKPLGVGKGAAGGALAGAAGGAAGGGAVGAAVGVGFIAGFSAFGPIGTVVGLMFFPVPFVIGAVGGTVFGAIGGGVLGAVAEEPIKPADLAVFYHEFIVAFSDKVPADPKMQEAMLESFLQTAGKRMDCSFTPLKEQGPTYLYEDAVYQPVAGTDMDTVLEIGVQWFGLTRWSRDSPCVFFVTVRARLVRPKDGSVVRDEKLLYKSEKRKFTEWAADDARLFREEFDHGYQNLSDQIVDGFFLNVEKESSSQNKKEEKESPFLNKKETR